MAGCVVSGKNAKNVPILYNYISILECRDRVRDRPCTQRVVSSELSCSSLRSITVCKRTLNSEFSCFFTPEFSYRTRQYSCTKIAHFRIFHIAHIQRAPYFRVQPCKALPAVFITIRPCSHLTTLICWAHAQTSGRAVCGCRCVGLTASAHTCQVAICPYLMTDLKSSQRPRQTHCRGTGEQLCQTADRFCTWGLRVGGAQRRQSCVRCGTLDGTASLADCE